MEVTEITLKKLLDNRLIKNIEKDGEYYFSKNGLNAIYDDNFKHVPHVTLRYKGLSNFQESDIYISWTEISEQVEHVKNMPNFDENIDKMFGFGKKR